MYLDIPEIEFCPLVQNTYLIFGMMGSININEISLILILG